MKCSYAACSESPSGKADGWLFCRKHLRLHHIEKVGAPRLRPGPRPRNPHGSVEAYRQHLRRGDRPCATCLIAHEQRRQEMEQSEAS